jgi:hypothetical protein
MWMLQGFLGIHSGLPDRSKKQIPHKPVLYNGLSLTILYPKTPTGRQNTLNTLFLPNAMLRQS